MAVSATHWLDLIQREYLSRFISGGGAAVKFIVAENNVLLMFISASRRGPRTGDFNSLP